MSKEKKISITHFENEKLKEISYGQYSFKPIYFRVVYDRKKVTLPSAWFTHYIEQRFNFTEENVEDLTKHDKKTISLIIEKQIEDNGGFSLDTFKYYYKQYSQNIFEHAENLLSEKLSELLEKVGFHQLSVLLNPATKKLDFIEAILIINEINHIYKKSKPNSKLITGSEYLEYAYYYLKQQSHVNSIPFDNFMTGKFDLTDELKLESKSVYFPLIRWIQCDYKYNFDMHESKIKSSILSFLDELHEKLIVS